MQIHAKPWKKFWKRFLPNERMSVFERLDVYRDDVRVSAALNMAIDEALLETATIPAIRFYGWARPSVSFGYFGKFAEAARGRRKPRTRSPMDGRWDCPARRRSHLLHRSSRNGSLFDSLPTRLVFRCPFGNPCGPGARRWRCNSGGFQCAKNFGRVLRQSGARRCIDQRRENRRRGATHGRARDCCNKAAFNMKG